MSDKTDWTDVTNFLNGVIEEASVPTLAEKEVQLELHIFSLALGQTMKVVVPSNRVEDFMKNLGLWEAEVYPGHPAQ